MILNTDFMQNIGGNFFAHLAFLPEGLTLEQIYQKLVGEDGLDESIVDIFMSESAHDAFMTFMKNAGPGAGAGPGHVVLILVP